MRLSWTSMWKVMTIWISRELPLFNFEPLDILCAWIGPPSEKLWPFWTSGQLPLFNFERLDILCPRIGYMCVKLWPFKFLESFHCSIPSLSIYYVPESDICVKSYDHSNFSRASVVQFLASRYIMSPNQTSEWNVMTIRICRKFRCSISNFSIYYVPESDIRVKFYDHSNFSRAFVVQFRASRWGMFANQIYCEMLWPFEFLECFRCSISRVSIFYVLESDIGVKCYDHSNLPRASVVQFRNSRYIMSPNRSSVWKVRPFEFLDNYRCSISSISI